MPGTASERGLIDPFDPAAAIPASAKFLNELKLRFGNLGLAAAAYNGGPTAAAHWLAKKGSLPFETEDYVLAVTGYAADEWRSDTPPAEPAPDKSFVLPEPGRHSSHDGAFLRRLGLVCALGRAACRQLLERLGAPRLCASPA